MSDDLRAPIVGALEKLGMDLALGRYGDPYVAFVVLVHPDQPPSIVAVSPRGQHDIAHIAYSDAEDAEQNERESSRFFTYSDFTDAKEALHDADFAWTIANYHHGRGGNKQSLGAYIVEHVREAWQRRRDRGMEREMEKAAYEATHPAVCPFCNRRFTERGLAQHRLSGRDGDTPTVATFRAKGERDGARQGRATWRSDDVADDRRLARGAAHVRRAVFGAHRARSRQLPVLRGRRRAAALPREGRRRAPAERGWPFGVDRRVEPT